MMGITDRLDDVRSVLDELVSRHRVPGASLAIYDGESLLEAATGIVNVNIGVAATNDTVFQIGSITKVYTTTLIMQLVDQGKVELDEPVKKYFPELSFGDEQAMETVSLRHLLSHTGGLEGDHFDDFGRGDEAVRKYVASCSKSPQLYPPGELWSYCNSGFVVAGRLIEKLTGEVWDAALKKYLFDPLGLTASMTLPEEVLLHRAAIGHLSDPDDPDGGPPRLAPLWHLPRAISPAGIISATGKDVLGFARLHLTEGRGPDGREILSSSGVKAMQEVQVRVPANVVHGGATMWGLGWMLLDWDGKRVIGHDGGTIGQSAFLRIAPDCGFAACLLTNGPGANALYRDLFEFIFREGVGIVMPAKLEAEKPGPVDLDFARYTGVFERLHVHVIVEEQEGRLIFSSKSSGPLEGLVPDISQVPADPVDGATFLVRSASLGTEDDSAVFLFEEGRAQWVYFGWRAHRRSADDDR